MDKPIKKNIKGIDVYYIKSSKFKTITWSFVFTHPAGTEHINEYYFLSNILVDNMKRYPTFEKKYRYLSSLYGLDAFSNALTIGANIINQFVITYPNEKYIEGECSLSEKAFDFLMEVITNPKKRDGSLTRKVLKDSLDEAKQSFNIMKSIKDMYAYYQYSKIFYQDKPNLQYNFPENERLDEVTLESLNAAYQDLFQESGLSLFVTGDFDEKRFDRIIETQLSDRFIHHPVPLETKKYPYELETETKTVREFDDVKQARMYIGYLTNINYYDRLHPAMGILNDILGGFDQSKLFLDIRERSHLAYYVDSHYLTDENMLVIPIICDFDKEQLVIEKVQNALQEIIDGDFSDELLEQAKNNALHSLYTISDSQPIYLLQHIKTYQLYNTRYDLDKRMSQYRKINRQDIIEAAKSLKLDTIYVNTRGGETND